MYNLGKNNITEITGMVFGNLQTLISDNPITVFSNNSLNLTAVNTISLIYL